MKRLSLLPTLFLLAAPAVVFAQAPRSHSLSLEASPTSAGSSVANAQNTNTTSRNNSARSGTGFSHSLNTTQTTTTTSKQALQISVRNLGVLPDNAHVEWYFIAQPVTPEPGKTAQEQQFAFDQGAKDVPLAGGATQAFPVESTEITASVKRNNRSRMGRSGKIGSGKAKAPTESGDKLSGWIVRVVADGKVVATKASSSNLEEIAKDDAKLKDLADR